MTGPLAIRRYRAGDREGLFDLYDTVYGSEKGAFRRRSWGWEYEENPANVGGPHVWVADTGGAIVGICSMIPAIALWFGERTRTSWYVDVMNHPDFRGRGIFGDLTAKAIEDSVNAGIELFVSFPNSNSGPIMRRRGWDDISVVPSMVKTLSLGAALGRVNRRNFSSLLHGGLAMAGRSLRHMASRASRAAPSSLRIRETEAFDSRMDAFFEEASRGQDFIVVRDERYLTWRYVRCLHRNYTILLAEEGEEVAGYIVLSEDRGDGRRGHIVDILTKPGPGQSAAIEALLGDAVRRLRGRGKSSIELCSMEDPYRTILEGKGFVSLPPHHFGGYGLVGRIEPPGSPRAPLGDIGRWFITRGDADTDIAAV